LVVAAAVDLVAPMLSIHYLLVVRAAAAMEPRMEPRDQLRQRAVQITVVPAVVVRVRTAHRKTEPMVAVELYTCDTTMRTLQNHSPKAPILQLP
jgi:hypothetical protein